MESSSGELIGGQVVEPQCFWCGGKTGGKISITISSGRIEAFEHFVFDYEPCPSCRSKFEEGILIICATLTAPEDGDLWDLPPIIEHEDHQAWPIWKKWCVLDEDSLLTIFKNEELIDQMKRNRRFFVDEGTWKAMGLDNVPDKT